MLLLNLSRAINQWNQCNWLMHSLRFPQVHTCPSWNANCTSNTLLPRCGSTHAFRSSHSVLDLDWCHNGASSLTAPMFARLHQLHAFKQRSPSRAEHSWTLHQHCHPIKGLLSVLLTHCSLSMDVDRCLAYRSVIMIL